MIWPRVTRSRGGFRWHRSGGDARAVLTHIAAGDASWKTLTPRGLRERFLELRVDESSTSLSRGHLLTIVGGVREAVRRVTGNTFYDVQILGGVAIAEGQIAEMATGEGKTLTAAIPAAVAALTRGGVHVMTPNAYLAERDFAELADVYKLLGLKAAALPEGDEDKDGKRRAYAGDVVYGTGYEFGFDYLKDHLAIRGRAPLPLGEATRLRLAGEPLPAAVSLTQPTRPMALVDEADSVLLDEAMTPLVLSGGGEITEAEKAVYQTAMAAIESLEADVHYRIEPGGRKVAMSDAIRRSRPPAGLPLRRPWWQYLEHALHARDVFARDIDYVVREGEVQIVDEQTGRVFEDRSWRAGLHQAVECREGVEITAERTTIARITRQRFTQLYDSLAGMTGTALPAAAEFRDVYGLVVRPIARRKPNRRVDEPTRYFADVDAKLDAVCDEARTMQRQRRPVLVGCRTIASSHAVSDRLTAAGVEHVVLDGVQDASEAMIVSQAGEAGRVTVATNMAGRGTDIKPDAAALDAGGLHVIATERHQSRRIDGQLIGRAARQGQPGSSRFFLAADDELFLDESRLSQSIARSQGRPSPDLDIRVARFQTRLEHRDASRRADMLRRDAWMEEVLESCAG